MTTLVLPATREARPRVPSYDAIDSMWQLVRF
jgi:hypothetical protein